MTATATATATATTATTTAGPTFTLEILRYDPEADTAPRWQAFTVPWDEDWVVLDALNWVKDHTDGTLTHRWSCHMAVCGSCGVMVNGTPALSCKSFLRDLLPHGELGGTIRVEPLRNFPIEKDLVVVLDGFLDKLDRVTPYLVRQDGERRPEDGPRLQLPRQLKRFKHHTLCINCLLCYAACPQVGLNPDFLGPAALALAHRYDLDSRDQGKAVRDEVTASHDGVWECTFVSACSEVCPKGVEPGGAIQEMKISHSIAWFMDHLMPWRAKR